MPIYTFQDKSPTLGVRVFVAPGASVIGDVVMGDECSVWFSAVLRGDMFPIRLGKRVNVQDGAVIHVTAGVADTVIGDDVTIGHLALVHGCHIGSRVLIGMGSIILDNVQIGDESLIAAGSLVPPRMVIPPRSFVKGSPAKVVRQTSDEDLAMIQAGVDSYRMFAQAYLSGDVREVPGGH
jgi:gamma-carbonic anhydrase